MWKCENGYTVLHFAFQTVINCCFYPGNLHIIISAHCHIIYYPTLLVSMFRPGLIVDAMLMPFR